MPLIGLRLAVLAGALAVAGCVSSTPGGGASTPLSGTTWRPIELRGAPLVETGAYVTFGEGLSGNDGCNNFFGDYTADSSRLDVGEEIGTTMMLCPWLTEAETGFVAALGGATRYERTSETLTLFNAAGDRLAVLEPSAAPVRSPAQ